jgi:hypothetical protein
MRQLELGLSELFGTVTVRAGAAALLAAACFLVPVPGHYLFGATVHGFGFAFVYAAVLVLTSSGTERAAARNLASSAWRTRLVDAR